MAKTAAAMSTGAYSEIIPQAETTRKQACVMPPEIATMRRLMMYVPITAEHTLSSATATKGLHKKIHIQETATLRF